MTTTTLLFFTLLCLVLKAVAETCPCRRNDSPGVCRSVEVTAVNNGVATCVPKEVPCGGCTCYFAGPTGETCNIISRTGWMLNGTGTCSMQTVDAAECPSSAAPTPPPSGLSSAQRQNKTTCCQLLTIGSVVDLACSVESWSSFGIDGFVTQIHRYIESSATVNTVYVANADTETFSQTTYRITGTFAQMATSQSLFVNFTDTTSTEGFMNAPGESTREKATLETYNSQAAFMPGTAMFDEILAISDPTIPFTNSLRFDLSGPGANMRYGRYDVRECLVYEFISA